MTCGLYNRLAIHDKIKVMYWRIERLMDVDEEAAVNILTRLNQGLDSLVRPTSLLLPPELQERVDVYIRERTP